ncbi:Protein Prrc2B [Manis pentadactyla]|nr:Protein Prrc2B [Manis pentadactyla]
MGNFSRLLTLVTTHPQANISVQVAVTKKPGCAVFGEENTWLDDIRSLLPTGKLQGRGPRPRVPVTRQVHWVFRDKIQPNVNALFPYHPDADNSFLRDDHLALGQVDQESSTVKRS